MILYCLEEKATGLLNLEGCSEEDVKESSSQRSGRASENKLKVRCFLGFPGGAVVESLPANAGDTGSSPGLGRSHMPRSN